MTDQPDFIDTIIDDMEDTHGSVDFFSTTRVAVRLAIERAIRETRPDTHEAKRWLEVESGPAPIDPLHAMYFGGRLIDNAREIIRGLIAKIEENGIDELPDDWDEL